MESGITSFPKLSQSSKARSAISSRVSGKLSIFNFGQSANDSRPMKLVLQVSNGFKYVAICKSVIMIIVTDFWNVNGLKSLARPNVEGPISVTFSLIFYAFDDQQS